MSKKFNLLLLHQPEDTHPRTWICLGGPKLKTILKDLEKDVLKNQGWCREKLSKKISNRLNCSHTTIKWLLLGKRAFYPIPVILEMSKFSKNRKKFLKEFKKNTEHLKVNSASAKPIKSVYKLNENLAKILGAFMADGSLSIQVVIAASQLKNLEKVKLKLTKLKINYSVGNSPARNQYYVNLQLNRDNFALLKKAIPSFRLLTQTHYSIELSEEYKDNVEAFIRWIKEEFDINPTNFKRERNAWRVLFSNKILARFMLCFFEVKPGPKSYYAHEPKIIKNSKLAVRKSFARGVLMFDGSITEEKKISFSTVSHYLFTAIKQIWEKDNIKFGKSINQRWSNYNPKNDRTLFTLFTTAENKTEKILEYFEPNTQKWKLIKWLSKKSGYAPFLRKDRGFYPSLKKILKILRSIKQCDTTFLQNYLNCSFLTVRTHLKVLRNQGKIRLSDHPSCINNYVSENATVLLKNKFHKMLFEKIRKKFKKDKNFANFLGIQKATLSAWRVRNNKMPIYILRKICKVLEIDFKKTAKNIKKIDREIAEII